MQFRPLSPPLISGLVSSTKISVIHFLVYKKREKTVNEINTIQNDNLTFKIKICCYYKIAISINIIYDENFC